jgi:predicted TIM-barrel fold metal-dependent hydrolase
MPHMATIREIRHLIDKTPFVDTHEHLYEETTRLKALEKGAVERSWAPDFGLLFCHYADADLVVAGMPPADVSKLFSFDVDVRDKWKLFEPWYARSKHTGYVQCVRESVRLVYDEEDLNEATYARISEKVRKQIQPGFYRPLLKETALVEHTQVNTLEGGIFQETQYPDLLCQDLSFVAMATGISNASILKLCELAHRSVSSLRDWHEVIDWCLETYGPKAIALKSQSAYQRRLDYADVDEATAAPVFEKLLKDEKSVTPAELKALQDHLFHYVVRKSVEYRLPVKLHTGYFAGHSGMPLERVAANLGDLCPVLKMHPKAKFVLMHIAYPYDGEAIAVTKHYPNVYVDMCWAWIINPMASVRFTKEFLMAAPHNKLLTFGGDYIIAELVPGHAHIARKGLAQSISELIDEDWLDDKEAPELIDRIMRGNANELFEYGETLKAWKV